MDETNKALEFLLENLELLSKNPCSLPCKLFWSLLRFSLPKLEIQEGQDALPISSEGAYATTVCCTCNVRRQGLITSVKCGVHGFLSGCLLTARHKRSSFLSSNERAQAVALCEDIRVIRSIFLRSREAGIENQQLKFLNHKARYWTCMALDATDNFLLGMYFSPLSSELAFFREYFNGLRRALSRMYFSDPSNSPIQM
ncbi:hypothetical protein HAX54_024802 [Datura stramonium]|uniref:Uncharacterized protein n=1 Tax=Datura stramonium TaxID=4076 RepID=A0ABS8S5W1_DATST|nr:hypothetical protein [Datura stramonium]